MNILLIGGTGNISSEVAALLFKKGHRITTVTTGKRAVPGSYTALYADRNDQKAFTAALAAARPDVVIDFIAFAPDHCRLDFTVFNGKVKQFIFISSATVYEKPHRKFPITERTPRSNRFWPYAQQKIACEEYLESVHSETFPVTIVRPSHTFGHEWIPSPFDSNDFTYAQRILDGKPIILHDKGESLWTLTAASDFAAGLCGLVGNFGASGEAFHITSDESLTWNQIYAKLGNALGKQPVFEYMPSEWISNAYPDAYGMLFGDKKEHGVFDNQKIKRFVPGFECKKSFDDAIGESVAWFMADSSRRIINQNTDSLIEHLLMEWKRSAH